MQNMFDQDAFSAQLNSQFGGLPGNHMQPGATLGGDDFQIVSEKDRTVPIFYPHAILDPIASREHKRPIYKAAAFIRIIQPGETSLVIQRPVKQSDIDRWSAQWERFCARKEAAERIGTPLEALLPFHPEVVMTLRAANVQSVEMLANMTDAAATDYGLGGGELRQRARRYLVAVNNPEGARAAIAAEDREKDQIELAKLKEEKAALLRMVQNLEATLAHVTPNSAAGSGAASYSEHGAPIPEDEGESKEPEAPRRRGPGRPPANK